MKYIGTGMLVAMAFAAPAQPGNNPNRALQQAVRQQQEWQRRQVPANSVLYKMNYGSMYPAEAGAQTKTAYMPFEAPVYAPPGRQASFGPGAVQPQQDGFVQPGSLSGIGYKPSIPLHHALLMRRTFLPPPGY